MPPARLALLPLALSMGCAEGSAPVGVASAATTVVDDVSPAPRPAPEQAPAVAPVARPAPAEAITLNQAILDEVHAVHAEGAPYVWSKGVNTDGVTQEVWWRGTLLAAPEASGGIHCSGVTFEVYVRALARVVGEDNGPSVEAMKALKEAWYVRDGGEQGPVGALVDAGLGDRVVGLAALQPGDLVQFWRNNGKGHSVVFMGPTRNSDGSVRGLVYWSAQGTSGGIGMRRTSPGPDINQINPNRLYGVRARWPAR